MWIDDLKKKLDALTDKDWEEEHFTMPDGVSMRLKAAPITIEMEPAQTWAFQPIIGHVNTAEIAGISPKKLMVSSLETTPHSGSVRFTLRNTIPWTHMFSVPAGKFIEVCDSKGNPIYPLADFSAIH